MKTIRYLIALVIIALVFGYMTTQVVENRDVLSAIPWHTDYGKIVLHIVGLLVMQALMCAGWSLILKRHGSVLGSLPLIYSYFVPNLGKYLPGKILFFAGRVELTYRVGSTRAVGFSTFLFECLFVVFAAAIFFPAVMILWLDLTEFTWFIVYSLVALVVWILTWKTDFLLSIFNRFLLFLKLSPLAIHLQSHDTRKILVLYVITWLVYGMSCALLAMAFVDLGVAEFLAVAAIFVVAWLIGFLSIVTPAGLGVREAVLIVLMQPMADNAIIVLLALLARISWTVVELGISSIALLLPVKFLKNNDKAY